MIRKISIFFTVLCIPFLCWFFTQEKKTSVRFLDREGKEFFLSLTVKDKKRLLCFMRMLFAEDCFAYTLLGSKPVSWASYQSALPFVNLSTFCNCFKKHHRCLRLGWETWQKYSHLFPAVSFWAETPKCYPGYVSILLVNEEQFNAVVNNNKKDFQEILHREIVNGFQLLKERKNRSLMNEILEGHQALLGIVLGYGRDNSWEFLRRSEKRDPLGSVWDETNHRKLGEIRTRVASEDINSCLLFRSCPSFAGNPNTEESLTLKKEYLLTQQKVIDYYKGQDFLEATLSLLAGFRPNSCYSEQ